MLFNGTDTGAPLKHALLSYNISIHVYCYLSLVITLFQFEYVNFAVVSTFLVVNIVNVETGICDFYSVGYFLNLSFFNIPSRV